jgi:hypothetical protein
LFTGDQLQRSELVKMTWKERQRLGSQCTNGMMKSTMHFRAKELNRRSAFPVKEVGKRTMDAWNHERVFVDKTVSSDVCVILLAEFVLPVKITSLDFTKTK